ncbi:hypothetical protein TOK_4430 [Pseudonocardia sp. N23]|nr:hypothetical protein TOK_4430 [Pseudonocardia sp. N23]
MTSTDSARRAPVPPPYPRTVHPSSLARQRTVAPHLTRGRR